MFIRSNWMICAIFLCVFLGLQLSLQAQDKTPIEQEFGLDVSFGRAGPLAPNRFMGFLTPDLTIDQESYGVVLNYNAYLLAGKLHLGAGLGFQHKRYIEDYLIEDNGQPRRYLISYAERNFTLPIAIGYRTQLGDRNNFFADVILTPMYLFQRRAQGFSQDTYLPPPSTSQHNRIGVDLGLQLGYRLDVSKKVSLQFAILGTVEPFFSDIEDRRYYTIGSNLGLRYQL